MNSSKIPVERCFPTILHWARFCTPPSPSLPQYVCSVHQASTACFWNPAKKLHSSYVVWDNPLPSFLTPHAQSLPPTVLWLGLSSLIYCFAQALFISCSIPILTEDILSGSPPPWNSAAVWGKGKNWATLAQGAQEEWIISEKRCKVKQKRSLQLKYTPTPYEKAINIQSRPFHLQLKLLASSWI